MENRVVTHIEFDVGGNAGERIPGIERAAAAAAYPEEAAKLLTIMEGFNRIVAEFDERFEFQAAYVADVADRVAEDYRACTPGETKR